MTVRKFLLIIILMLSITGCTIKHNNFPQKDNKGNEKNCGRKQ